MKGSDFDSNPEYRRSAIYGSHNRRIWLNWLLTMTETQILQLTTKFPVSRFQETSASVMYLRFIPVSKEAAALRLHEHFELFSILNLILGEAASPFMQQVVF